ncbi:MAG: hypothetical protein QM490_00550 [Candidatus Gracilibacteria bacterium]
MKTTINNEFNEHSKFNLISLYTRYALSLLVGTRTFKHSANLESISYELKIMRIVEKSETSISGIRIIPICDTALKLLKNYQIKCQELGVPSRNFYYIDSVGEHKLFNIKSLKKELKIPEVIYNFIDNVPLNFGRHIFTKLAIERNFPRDYLDAYLGHYSVGLEQFGMFSSMINSDYIESIRNLTEVLAKVYGVSVLLGQINN